jgi:hypothetical protein
MARYLISFDAHAMDHIPDEDMPAVGRAAHEVVEEAMNAGVWVFGGGLETQKASVVATDGTVTNGPYPEAIGGFWVVDVPSREEALEWAAKTAAACRCAQEVACGSSGVRSCNRAIPRIVGTSVAMQDLTPSSEQCGVIVEWRSSSETMRPS